MFVDSSKAFGRIPHDRLLEKPRAFGATGPLLHWIKDSLVGRNFSFGVSQLKGQQHQSPARICDEFASPLSLHQRPTLSVQVPLSHMRERSEDKACYPVP